MYIGKPNQVISIYIKTYLRRFVLPSVDDLNWTVVHRAVVPIQTFSFDFPSSVLRRNAKKYVTKTILHSVIASQAWEISTRNDSSSNTISVLSELRGFRLTPRSVVVSMPS